MTDVVMRFAMCALILVSAQLGCSDDPVGTDGGQGGSDALSLYDGGVLDLGVRDSGPRPDVGPRDSGFSSPEILRAGTERVPVQSAVHATATSTLNIYIEIHTTGTSTLPPVFVPARGPGTSSEYLPEHMQFLVSKRRVIYYDIRGAGRSSYGDGTMNSTITVAQHTNDLAGLIDYVGRLPDGIDTSRVDIVAHGYGALLAMRYASTHPTRVDHLVLVSPYPLTIDENVDLRGEIENRIGSVDRERLYQIIYRPECWQDDEQCYVQAWNITGRYYLCPENRDLFSELTFTTGSFRNEFFFIAQDLRNRSYDDRPFLAGVRATTTVISGPCEPTPAETALGYATIQGATHIILPGTGEFALVEDPPAFQNAVFHGLGR